MQKKPTPDTPLMRQYKDIKRSYSNAIVFFRLGDFYEMFDEDAKTASKVLGLVLTARHGVPMCGVPFHSSSGYINKLLKEGFKVAICEQIADEFKQSEKTKLVKREVTRIVTPGTILEDELLNSKVSNHLVSIEGKDNDWGLSCVEVSTGNFWSMQVNSDDGLRKLAMSVSRLYPSEIIGEKKFLDTLKDKKILRENLHITSIDDMEQNGSLFEWANSKEWKQNPLALNSARNAVTYIEKNEPHLKNSLLPYLTAFSSSMELDENAVTTLELVKSSDGARQNTLWGTLDNTLTPMGSRMLREWILQPLLDVEEIRTRQNSVAKLIEDIECRNKLSEILDTILDIERLMGRVVAMSASPKDVFGLKQSLANIEPLKKWCEQNKQSMSKICDAIIDAYPKLREISDLLDSSVSENPPMRISDGNVIKPGYNKELDELRDLKTNSRTSLRDLENREKTATQIPTLKVGYNSVFGYYIEVTKANLSKVPSSYIRKQTLVNNERFITQELKEMEAKILGAEDRIVKLESHLFDELKRYLSKNIELIRNFARTLAELDVYYAYAVSAIKGNYVKPEIDLSTELVFNEARHPVVERNIPAGTFVPNDLNINEKNPQIMIITGPNMSGKSVYLRQNALITIMAQIGSYVPAKRAKVGIVDKIMTRIGAHDALNRGESTFMVEMKETAQILSSVTKRSLVLLDEIGRGTSTFDGISIAWSVNEFLYHPEGGPKVLFATHYFELTELEQDYEGIKNFNVEVKEKTSRSGKTELIFLHKISPGPADRSYGIHVAELAGLPDSCILRSKKILKLLEENSNVMQRSTSAKEQILPGFIDHPIIGEIKDCNPEKITPISALQIIQEWKKRLS
jgi:DNA mismatch repair protein MutS